MSYNRTKKFIESSCKPLERGLEIDDNIRSIIDGQDSITAQQFQHILRQVNVRMKRHHKNMFLAQAIGQIAQQVVKNEQNRALEATEQLVRAQMTILPLVVPELETALSLEKRLAEFLRLVKELPELRYLQHEDADPELLERYENARLRVIELSKKYQQVHRKKEYLQQLLAPVGSQEEQEQDLSGEIDRFHKLVRKMQQKTAQADA